MRIKAVLFIFVFFFSLLQVQGKTTGYLSFEYVSGRVENEDSSPTFKNVQLGFIFSGEIQGKFYYTAEVKSWESKVEIEQALVRFKPSTNFSLSAGLYLIPFGRYNQSNRPHQTLLVRLPLHVETMYPSSWRDIGILIDGDFGSLFYSAYLGNGLAEAENLKSSQQFKENNKIKAKGGRIGLSLSEKLVAAVSYYRGKYDENAQRNLTLQGVDFIWEPGSLQFLFEYSKAELENPEPYSFGEASGYLIQMSFPLWNFRPVVSYQCFNYEDPFHGEGFTDSITPGEGILKKQSRWSVGIVYFPSSNLLVKIEYDYDRDKILELKNNTFSVQVALSF